MVAQGSVDTRSLGCDVQPLGQIHAADVAHKIAPRSTRWLI